MTAVSCLFIDSTFISCKYLSISQQSSVGISFSVCLIWRLSFLQMCFLSLYSVPVIDGGRSTLISTGVWHVFSKHQWKRLVLMRVKASSSSGNLCLAVWLVRRSGSSTCPAGCLGSVSIPWGWLTKQQKFVSQLCCLEVQIRLLSGLGSESPGRKREASS